MRSEEFVSILSTVATALLAVTFERGLSVKSAYCPNQAVAGNGRTFTQSGSHGGPPQNGHAFDLCSPEFLETPMIPTSFLPHSDKSSQPADKKR